MLFWVWVSVNFRGGHRDKGVIQIFFAQNKLQYVQPMGAGQEGVEKKRGQCL
jgi:hypothetical protein